MSTDDNQDHTKSRREGFSKRKSAAGSKSQPRVRVRLEDAPIDDVGYSKPPRAHQFKSGQSGNPKGRPKGSRNESTILREVLHEKVSLRQPNGRTRKILILEGIHRKQAELALKGDTKSAAFVLNRYAALVSGELHPEDLSEDDRAVLDAFTRRIQGPANGS